MTDASVVPIYPLDSELTISGSKGTTLRVTWPFSLEVDGIQAAFTREAGLPVKYALGPIGRIVGLIPMNLGISEIVIAGSELTFVIAYSSEGLIEEFLARIQDFQNRGAVEVSHLHEKYDGCTCGDPGRPNHKVFPPEE